MTVSQDAATCDKDNTDPVFSLTINLKESTIVAILTLLVGVGFGVQIGGNNAAPSAPLPVTTEANNQ